MHKLLPSQLFFWLVLTIALSGAHAAEPEILVMSEQSATVATDKLLPTKLLKSDAYTLAPETEIYQGVAIYKMDSDFGQSTLVGGTGLIERIDELSAIDKLRAMKGSDVYKEALKKSGKAPVETVKNLAKEPVDTMKDIGRGLG